jgi:hypothetical protein
VTAVPVVLPDTTKRIAAVLHRAVA